MFPIPFNAIELSTRIYSKTSVNFVFLSCIHLWKLSWLGWTLYGNLWILLVCCWDIFKLVLNGVSFRFITFVSKTNPLIYLHELRLKMNLYNSIILVQVIFFVNLVIVRSFPYFSISIEFLSCLVIDLTFLTCIARY